MSFINFYHAFPWLLMASRSSVPLALSSHGFYGPRMGFLLLSWVPMDPHGHGFPWQFMGFRGFPSLPMGFPRWHGVLWLPMAFGWLPMAPPMTSHGFPSFSFVRMDIHGLPLVTPWLLF